jgi:hypothetical protein
MVGMCLTWRKSVRSVCFESLEGRIHLSETSGNGRIMILWWSFVLQSSINARKKGGSMHSKNISVVNVLTYLLISSGLCYKYKNFLTFDEQFRLLFNLHVTKLLSSQSIVDTCCLYNLMHVVRFSSFSFICRYMIFMSVLSFSFHMKLAAVKGFKTFLTEA